MNRFFLWSLMVLCIVRSASGGEWCVIQENGSIPQSAWQSNSTEQKITILESMGEQVFVFHVVEFVDPCPQACEPQCTCQCMWDEDVQYEAADLNVLDSALNPADPGQEIHFEIRTARNVARIAVEPDNPMYADNVTTDIVHLDITGDFLETAAMTVDQVTGPIAVGGSVLNTFNINGDLATEIDIGVNVEWGVEVMVGHDLASTGTIHVHGDVRGSIGVNGSCDPAYGLRGSIIVDGNLAAQSKTDWGYIWVERDVHPGGLIHVGGAVEGDLDQAGPCTPEHQSGSMRNARGTFCSVTMF